MVLNKTYNLYSPAKINFYLKVIKKLPSGLHKIESFVALIDLRDHLQITETNKTATNVKFKGKFAKSIDNLNNSITKLIFFLQKMYPILEEKKFNITIYKRIPTGAGLGGGSSNAVTIFQFLKTKFKLKVSNQNLSKIYNYIGADSKIFSDKNPKFVDGIGDKVQSVTQKIKLNLLLIYPNKPNLTARIYKMNKVFSKQGTNIIARKLIKKNILNLFNFGNDLFNAATKSNPSINQLIKFIEKQKICDFIRMSGSGSCCYLVFKSKKNLLKCEKLVKTKFRSYWTAVTKTIT